MSKKNIIYLVLLFLPLPLNAQTSNTNKEELSLKHKFSIDTQIGLHFGDSRFYTGSIGFFSLGYYFSNKSGFFIEYSPIYVKSRTDDEPIFYFNHVPLTKGTDVVINEFFFSYKFRVFKPVWMSLGVAAGQKFSLYTGISSKFFITNKIVVNVGYKLISVGQPLINDLGDFFFTNSITCGIELLIN